MRTDSNDSNQQTEPPAGEPYADAESTPGGADRTDRTDRTDTNAQNSGPDHERPGSQGSRIVELALERGAELFLDLNDQPYVTLPVGGHRETLPVDGIGRLAGKLFYDRFAQVPTRQALQDAIGVLTGTALYEGVAHPVWTRLAEHAGRLYLDLGDASWQAIEIEASGWRVIPSGQVPVKFRRPKGMLPLPVPERGGSLHALDLFLNVADAQDGMLIKSSLIGAYCLSGGRPILELIGEQGSSKSTVARMLRRLIDPCSVPLRAAPDNEQDLMIAAKNGLVVAFDNLSEVRPALSDALCRLSTGGGIGGRKLYTDHDEAVLEAQRPVLITSITGVATRGDLLDRTISITLPPISAERRRTESALWAEFDQAVPGMLGGLFDAVSAAICNRQFVQLKRTPRLADFVTWVEAAAPALGWQRGQFLAAFEAIRQDQDKVAVESEAIGPALLALMMGRDLWKGTAAELLTALNTLTPEELRKDPTWPRNASQLGKRLARITPNLRRLGTDVEKTRDGSGGDRRITLTRASWDDSRQSRQSRQGNGSDGPADQMGG